MIRNYSYGGIKHQLRISSLMITWIKKRYHNKERWLNFSPYFLSIVFSSLSNTIPMPNTGISIASEWLNHFYDDSWLVETGDNTKITSLGAVLITVFEIRKIFSVIVSTIQAFFVINNYYSWLGASKYRRVLLLQNSSYACIRSLIFI